MKKDMEHFDATTPEEYRGGWRVDLIYNGKVYGSLLAPTEATAKKFVKQWVEAKKKS